MKLTSVGRGKAELFPLQRSSGRLIIMRQASPRDNENAGVVYFMKLSPWQKAGVRLVLHSPRLTLNLSLLLYDGYFLGKSSDIASPIPKNLFHNRNGSAVKNVR